MPKDTNTLGNNKARAWESLGFAHKKRGCDSFDTPSVTFRYQHDRIFRKDVDLIFREMMKKIKQD